MSSPAQIVTAADYARAERFLFWNKDRYIVNGNIQHHWIGSEDRFWYLRTTERGKKAFVVVEARTGHRTAAFDHDRVADGLCRATGSDRDPSLLPFNAFRYTRERAAIEFRFADQLWQCDLETGCCTARSQTQARPGENLSPDGAWAVSLREHNLWIRATASGAQFPLTSDGTQYHGYAGEPGDCRRAITGIRCRQPTPPQVLWSPNSRYLLSHRIDERRVRDMHLLQSVPDDGSARPKLFPFRYALPGDEHVPLLEPVIFEIGARCQVDVATAPLHTFLMSLIAARNAWWSADSTTVYYLNFDRYSKRLTLNCAGALDGKVTQILRESSDTFLLAADGGLHNNPSIRILSNGDIVWYSERDGWGHLYYYDRSGRLRNQITRGAWVVRGIVHVDEAVRRIYFRAGGREPGRDPYYQHLYSVDFDGSHLTLLTPEDAEHQLHTCEQAPSSLGLDIDTFSTEEEKNAFSPSGRYFVYTYSRPDRPPVMVVREVSGRLIREVDAADVSKLKKGGYTPIEPFEVTAADGKTALYGNIFRPSAFDPSRRYPVIDSIYPGPQSSRSPKSFLEATFDLQGAAALAEVGFIVVTVDGRGTPHRSKAFLDDCYGNMGKAGNLEDHIAALRQLAQRYSHMDLDRVGIYGRSGGGYASARAILTHPDFYKVAVAAEGNHDQLANYAAWGETYNGPVGVGDYANSANQALAASLTGKLLLMHGDMDDNVPPAQTFKLVDALIRANKDFDLLVIPNGNHSVERAPYFIRRKWDYFVRHLLGAEPPSGYAIEAPAWLFESLNW